MTPSYFHFTLGPVQSFVSQARRTRDFWAGSFILSWLSAVAMRAVQKQDGDILFPQPDDAFMAALESGTTNLKQGNIPNRFKASVPNAFDPKAVEAAVRFAWKELAETVWKGDLRSQCNGKTRTIWDRQIAGFWDIQWALTEDANDSSILDRMKTWRTHLPPSEPGIKCMMMDGWQELSGEERPSADALDKFWNKIRDAANAGIRTDLRKKECLCAIGFVKRRFARYFKDFNATMPSGWMLKGWTLPNGVPSVHYIAAAPWLAQLFNKADKKTDIGRAIRSLLGDFHKNAYELTGEYGEWESNIQCVQDSDGERKWKALDGTVFFDASLENENLWENPKAALEVLRELKTLRTKAEIEPVSPFYAVLLMDGDELGIHMSDANKQAEITKGLAKFTKHVPQIVQQNNGFLIYAGGDDVLALLPLENALGCAAALRHHYRSCFNLQLIPTSLSGAVEFAHVKMPLGKVLRDAHDLLDNLAKDGRGRDAIACRVWKPGGMTLEWAMPWKCALNKNSLIVEQLAQEFQPPTPTIAQPSATPLFSSKFFFKIRERFELLNPGERVFTADQTTMSATQTPPLTEAQAIALMAAEYLNSGVAAVQTLADASQTIERLLKQCRPTIRDKSEPDASRWKKSNCLEADGALLVRFLAQKGIEQ